MSLDKDSWFKHLKETQINHDPIAMQYLEKQKKWMLVSQNGIEYVAPLPDTILKANALYKKGIKMLKVGFYKPGLKKLIKAVEVDPMVHPDSVQFDLAKKENFPLYIAGQVLLKQHNLCWKNNPKESIQALFNYAYIAAKAGQLGLTRQAVNEIKRLNNSDSGRVPEDAVNMMVTALEALIIAVQGDPEAAYDHMIGNDGIVSENFTDIKTHIITMPNYWGAFYSDRKKLAYLLDVKIHDLPSKNQVKAPYLAPQPYPDLNGNLINPPGTASAPKIKTEQKKVPTNPLPILS